MITDIYPFISDTVRKDQNTIIMIHLCPANGLSFAMHICLTSEMKLVYWHIYEALGQGKKVNPYEEWQDFYWWNYMFDIST